MYWVLFFITDNQEFQHGIPGGLCFFFIMDNQELGSPGVLGFIFYNGQRRISESRVYFFITDNQEFLHGSPGVLG